MTTISVRVSEEDKNELKKYGELSKVIREAIHLYLGSKRSREAIERLKTLQRVEVARVTRKTEVALIKEDRQR